jgi:WD40 repeat protein
MSNDGVLGASAGDDFTIRVWDLDHRVCLKTCKGHSGWVVAVKVGRGLQGALWEGRCLLRQAPRARTHARTHTSPKSCCAMLIPLAVHAQFLGDSHTLVSASHDGTARVWDAWTGDWLATLQGHTGRLNAVVASRDGGLIVTCSDDNTARVWHGSTYKLVRWVGGVVRGPVRELWHVTGGSAAKVLTRERSTTARA